MLNEARYFFTFSFCRSRSGRRRSLRWGLPSASHWHSLKINIFFRQYLMGNVFFIHRPVWPQTPHFKVSHGQKLREAQNAQSVTQVFPCINKNVFCNIWDNYCIICLSWLAPPLRGCIFSCRPLWWQKGRWRCGGGRKSCGGASELKFEFLKTYFERNQGFTFKYSLVSMWRFGRCIIPLARWRGPCLDWQKLFF